MKSALVALGCALMLAVSGCGGDDGKPKANTSGPPTAAPSTGFVQGTLQLVGGPAPGTPQPVAGTVTFTGPDGSVAKAPVDKTGKFSIGLNPGSYRIRGTSPLINDGRTTCTTETAKVTLTAGRTVTADVVCSVP